MLRKLIALGIFFVLDLIGGGNVAFRDCKMHENIGFRSTRALTFTAKDLEILSRKAYNFLKSRRLGILDVVSLEQRVFD